jgi:3-oxoacyl-[acyl-carrier-protein] synthase-3
MNGVVAAIGAIEYALPARSLSNEELAASPGGWTASRILQKTGIGSRRVAGPSECASDLAAAAAERLFDSGAVARRDVDFLLLCTQSPDYFLPTTACILQERLGLRTSVGALDFNLGCSGYVYGLGLAKGLIETGLARNVLLLTAETYSKFIHPDDRSVRTIFGDGAAATLVRAERGPRDLIGPFVFGTDGSGARNLIVPRGALRMPFDPKAEEKQDASGNTRTENNLFMDGPEIFAFTLREVPRAVTELLSRANLQREAVDLFVLHQANAYMLEQLRRKMAIDPERFVVALESVGNTVSSTIPIALRTAMDDGRLKPGMRVALVGFGVGYSWGACTLEWSRDSAPEGRQP